MELELDPEIYCPFCEEYIERQEWGFHLREESHSANRLKCFSFIPDGILCGDCIHADTDDEGTFCLLCAARQRDGKWDWNLWCYVNEDTMEVVDKYPDPEYDNDLTWMVAAVRPPCCHKWAEEVRKNGKEICRTDAS